jgi:hypothetical protein
VIGDDPAGRPLFGLPDEVMIDELVEIPASEAKSKAHSCSLPGLREGRALNTII